MQDKSALIFARLRLAGLTAEAAVKIAKEIERAGNYLEERVEFYEKLSPTQIEFYNWVYAND